MGKNDYISHSAHYSKNWDTQKQNDYNKWYYQQHKEKWANSEETARANKTHEEYNKAYRKADTANKLSKIYAGRAKSKWMNLLDTAKKEGTDKTLKDVAKASKEAYSYAGKATLADAKRDLAKGKYKSAKRRANRAIKKDMNSDTNKAMYELTRRSKQKAARDAMKKRDKEKAKAEGNYTSGVDDWLDRTFGYKKKKKFNPNDHKQTRT